MANTHQPVAALVLPTYNERENLLDLAAAIRAQPVAIQIVVVDDNSPDCTAGETPIIFADRRLGQSKISKNEIYRAMRTVAWLGLRRLKGKFTRCVTRDPAPA